MVSESSESAWSKRSKIVKGLPEVPPLFKSSIVFDGSSIASDISPELNIMLHKE